MNCDSIAHWYWLMERCAFGSALERRRGRFLDRVTEVRQVLALGDGDGRALVDLLRACPAAHVDYVDLSPKMLGQARKRARQAGLEQRVSFHCANALKLASPVAHYDLVVTHFFLDCLDEEGVAELSGRLRQCLRPGARWIISEFQDESAWARTVVRLLYLYFGVTTELQVNRLAGYRPILERNGFQMIDSEIGAKGLLISELWSLR